MFQLVSAIRILYCLQDYDVLDFLCWTVQESTLSHFKKFVSNYFLSFFLLNCHCINLTLKRYIPQGLDVERKLWHHLSQVLRKKKVGNKLH